MSHEFTWQWRVYCKHTGAIYLHVWRIPGDAATLIWSTVRYSASLHVALLLVPQVMPPLLKALKDLSAIDKGSIAELKVMRNPPAGALPGCSIIVKA